jgi:hypothetical protein
LLLVTASVAIAAERDNLANDGRMLPDGTIQPRNLKALYEYPAPDNYTGNNRFLRPEEALSVDWGPEVPLSVPSFSAFFSTIAEGPNGFVHAFTSWAGGMEPYYVRSIDTGESWEPGYLLWPLGGPQAGMTREIFSKGDTTAFIFSSGAAVCVLSPDRGDTWEHWRIAAYGSGTIAACRLNDTIYVANSDQDATTIVKRSADNGATWQAIYRNTHLSDVFGLGATTGLLHMVNHNYSGHEVYYSRLDRAGGPWSVPLMLSEDFTEGSFYPKLLAWGDSSVLAFWTDYQHSPYGWTGDIFCRRSTDGGLTWLPIVEVTQNHLALDKSVCQRGDSIFLVYDEYVFDGETEGEEIFFNLSTDGGFTWSEPTRLSFAPHRSIYPSVGIRGDRIHVSWCDARGDTLYGNRNRFYYRRGILRGPDGVADEGPDAQVELSLSAYPNPFNSATAITIEGGGEAEIDIFDITGRRVAALNAHDGRAVWDATGYSSGVYFARAADVRQGSVSARVSSIIKLVYLK